MRRPTRVLPDRGDGWIRFEHAGVLIFEVRRTLPDGTVASGFGTSIDMAADDLEASASLH